MQTALQHHFLEIARAESIAKIPTHAQQNHLRFKMTPSEQLGMLHEKDLFLCQINPTLLLCQSFFATFFFEEEDVLLSREG
jgi:hypothetical protein